MPSITGDTITIKSAKVDMQNAKRNMIISISINLLFFMADDLLFSVFLRSISLKYFGVDTTFDLWLFNLDRGVRLYIHAGGNINLLKSRGR